MRGTVGDIEMGCLASIINKNEQLVNEMLAEEKKTASEPEKYKVSLPKSNYNPDAKLSMVDKIKFISFMAVFAVLFYIIALRGNAGLWHYNPDYVAPWDFIEELAKLFESWGF